jgi:hypothetical protein
MRIGTGNVGEEWYNTSMKKIKEMVDLLSYLGTEGKDNPNLSDVIEIEDVSLPLAFAISFGYAELTDKGISELEQTYDFFVEVANERGIKDLYDLVDVDTPIIPRKMTISITKDGKFV